MPILQINFKVKMPAADYERSCRSVAEAIADVPGLQWKVWLLNEAAMEAGGIYFFDTEQALNDYLAGPIVARIKEHPAIEDVSAKRFDVLEEVTAITRGPARARAAGR